MYVYTDVAENAGAFTKFVSHLAFVQRQEVHTTCNDVINTKTMFSDDVANKPARRIHERIKNCKRG
jgi:hypothetical protein